MNKAFGRQLAYARFAGPLIMAAIFLFCSTFGLFVGMSANVSHPGITAFPVYPNATEVSALTPGRMGMLSTPTIVAPPGAPTMLTNFVFSTTDSPDRVIAYYRDVMEKQYGMQVQNNAVLDKDLNTTSGVTALRYGRSALYSDWTVGVFRNGEYTNTLIPRAGVIERVTITVDARTQGVTRTTIAFETFYDPGHTSPYQPR